MSYNLTARQHLEKRGAYMYLVAYIILAFFATFFQHLSGLAFRDLLPAIVMNGLNLVLASVIFMKKRKGVRVFIIPWILGFTSVAAPILTRYNYALHQGWTFAAMSYNTTTLMICLIVMLYLFYQPRLYLFYSMFAIFNWLLFLYFAQKNGALFQMNTEINGVPVITGLIVLREFYVMIVMIVIMLVAYRSIPDTLKFEKKVTDQTEQLQKNAESRLKMTGIIGEKVDVLFDKVNTQNELIVQFNQKMETQSVSFAEMSATMEELAGAAEQIAVESVRQIDGNVKMEAIVEEFKNIQVETKKNLDETYADIQSVSDKSSMANERLMDVEKTVVSIREQSDRIAETVNLIVDIADKINLLSLNASIEAARAGEAGRGFAVVADEIGKLAYQTQESIKVIESVLSASSRNTVDGVAVIQGTAGMVRDMISHMKESANKVQTLQESIFIEEKYIRIIIGQMTENISLSKRIGSATDEQKVAVETTSKALENLIEILNEMVGELKELAQLAKDIYENADDVKVDTAKALNG